MSASTAVHRRSPLERASHRLHRSSCTAEACYDDLAAPSWDSYRRSRARFLDPPPRREPAEANAGVSNEAGHGG